MLAPEAQATTIAFSVPRSGFGVNAGKSIGSIRFVGRVPTVLRLVVAGRLKIAGLSWRKPSGRTGNTPKAKLNSTDSAV
jgi:hypothetical protein